jgi:hypothetical protein
MNARYRREPKEKLERSPITFAPKALVVVGAELTKPTVVLKQVLAKTRILCPIATMARLLPRFGASRWKRAAKYVFLVRAAAQAAWFKVRRSQRFPLRVLPLLRLPARSLLPGHIPPKMRNYSLEGIVQDSCQSQPPCSRRSSGGSQASRSTM